MSQFNFQPWVGSNYKTAGFYGKKILILGESHYCTKELSSGGRCFPLCKKENMNSDCFSMTNDVINSFVNNYEGVRYEQTLLCFERSVLGKELTQKEREIFWNSIIFYNYIQYSLPGPNNKPQSEQWQKSEAAFRELLEEYMPDCIIVWGTRLFNIIPEWNGKHSILAISESDSTHLWTYDIKGKKIPAIEVQHPCCPLGKRRDYWHKFYVKFLELPE